MPPAPDVRGSGAWRRLGAALLLLGVIAAALAVVYQDNPRPNLVIVDEDGASVLTGVEAGERFQLSYVHSIYRAPAVEHFVVQDSSLVMTHISSTSEAVIDYYALDGARRATGGWHTLSMRDSVRYEELRIIGTEVGQRTVVVGGRCYPLFSAAGSRHATLRITVATARARRVPVACPPGDVVIVSMR